jgi:hypothetical protein
MEKFGPQQTPEVSYFADKIRSWSKNYGTPEKDS